MSRVGFGFSGGWRRAGMIALTAVATVLAVPVQAETGSVPSAVHSAFPDMSDEELTALVQRGVRHLALEIEATPEQTEKMATVVSALVRELRPVYARMAAAGKRFEQLLLAETIDRGALEELRSEHVTEADRASRLVVDGLAELAELLDVGQRQKLRALVHQFGALAHGLGAN